MEDNENTIVLLLRDFSGGGAERSIINLANGFADHGLNVELVVFNINGPFRKYVNENVEIVSLDVDGIGWRASFAVLPLIRHLKLKQVSHVISTLEATTIVAYFALKLVRKSHSLVIRVATTFGMEQRGLFRNSLIRMVYQRHSGLFLVNSHGSKDNLASVLEIDRSRIMVVYNGVDLDVIDLLSYESHQPPELWKNPGRYIVHIGRLTTAKRQDLLIRSFASIFRKQEDMRLLIIGEGPLRTSLESLVAQLGLCDSVFLPGFIENPYPYLSEASAFVLSSDYEGMPTVLIEALALGCPVVATDCMGGGSREILGNDEWGLVTPVNDVEALSQGILQVLRHPIAKANLKKRAREFSSDSMVRKYMLILGCS